MKNLTNLFFLITTLITSETSAQKKKIIIFGDLGIGYAKEIKNSGGIIQYGSVNFEKNKNLFTFRYSEFNQLGIKIAPVSFTSIPFPSSDFKNTEIALLYGKRYIENGFSYSFSGGISTNKYEAYKTDDNNKSYTEKNNHIGFPIEFSIKWFKAEKKPYRIYGIIPVGKPTALGNSIGFKFLGNISKHSYLAIGVDFGIGYHKEY